VYFLVTIPSSMITIFPSDYACNWYLVVLNKKPKTKKILPPCGTMLRACRRAARRQVPGAVIAALAQEIDSAAAPHGGRDLTHWDAAAGAWRHGLRLQMYICRKFWFDPIFFENHDKLNIKKFQFERERMGWAFGIIGLLSTMFPVSEKELGPPEFKTWFTRRLPLRAQI
jgi:hypothetical protein